MTADPPLGAPFAMLATASCPAYAEMLIAIEREFRALDRAHLADTLNELARPLFDLGGLPLRRQATAIAAAAREALPHDGNDPRSWLLGSALDQRRASPPVRAVLAVELARRAGIPARPVRMRGRWLVGMHDHGPPIAADVGDDPVVDGFAPCTGCLCGHEIAFHVLGGLARAWRASGDAARTSRASGLRMLLPLDAAMRAQVLEETLRLGKIP